VLDKTIDDKAVDIDDVGGDDALAGPAGATGRYTRMYLAAAGSLRRSGRALALSRQRTLDFFVHAWRVLRTEGPVGALRHIWQFFISQSFSSLTRRIVFFNVAGLLAFVLGIMYLAQFRAGLIDARVQTLRVQGETIGTAIAFQQNEPADPMDPMRESADPMKIDLKRLFEIEASKSYNPSDNELFDYQFPLNPEHVAPLLRRLITPSNTLARVYGRDGMLLLDSRNLRGDVLAYDLPSPTTEKPGFLERTFLAIRPRRGPDSASEPRHRAGRPAAVHPGRRHRPDRLFGAACHS
jgi:hypothetical protein